MTPADLAATHAAAFTRSRPWSAAEFAGLLTQRRCHVIGDADCFALFTLIADETELLTIATDPACSRQGLGRACLAAYETQAVARGARISFLEVAADNAAARALYDRHGFKLVSETEDDPWGAGVGEQIFEWRAEMNDGHAA